MISILDSLLTLLEGVTVSGKDNLYRLHAAIVTLENLKTALQKSEKEANHEQAAEAASVHG